MQLLDRTEIQPLLEFVSNLKKDLKSWQMVEVSLTGKTLHNIMFIARQVEQSLANREGVLFVCDTTHILGFVKRLTEEEVAEEMARQVENGLPKGSCVVASEKVTPNGMKRIDIKINNSLEAAGDSDESSLLMQRVDRKENVLMVVDDDKFMLNMMVRILKTYGVVIELSSVKNVIDNYLQYVPDIVFMDIHMPQQSGLEVSADIYKYDKNAHIIMFSGAGTSSNVLGAKALGVRGFVAKPFKPSRIRSVVEKCGTIRATNRFI